MSGQVQFDGKVPFTDRRTGARVEVRVWGAFVGHGVDPHEEQPIREWIINAFSSSAAAYEGDVQELARMGNEWGAYVSQQIAPQLAQYFQAQGTVNVQGVQVMGNQAASPSPMPFAAVSAPHPAGGVSMPGQVAGHVAKGGSPQLAHDGHVAKGGGGPATSGSLLEAAQAALVQRMGASPDLARQAATIVLEVVEAHRGGAAEAKGGGGHAKDGGHGQPPAGGGYGKDGGQPGYGKDGGQPGYGKDGGQPGYGKDGGQAGYGNPGEPGKGGYGGEPWKK